MGIGEGLAILGKALGAGLCMGIGAIGPAIGEGNAVGKALEGMARQAVPSPRCVLVACLGNPRVTSDSLGPCVAHSLEVTRHVQLLDTHAFSGFGKGTLCLNAANLQHFTVKFSHRYQRPPF